MSIAAIADPRLIGVPGDESRAPVKHFMRGLILVLAVMLAGCSRYEAYREAIARNEAANTPYPPNYRSEILTLLRPYLNDPTQVRDAYISDPVIKTIDGAGRYAV